MRPQFDSVHHQNRRLSSHSYSHETVIFFVFFGLILFKLRRVCFFEFKMHAATPAAVANKEMRVSPLYSDTRIGDSRLHTVLGCGTRSPLYLMGDAASHHGLCTGRVFHHAQRPVERAPAYICYTLKWNPPGREQQG